MKNKRAKQSKIKIGLIGMLYSLVMMLLAASVVLVSIFKIHLLSGTDLTPYVENSNLTTKTLKAERGTIYDRNSAVIAQDTQTYNIICYLNEKRTGAGGKPAYVVDPVDTAKKMAKHLEMDEMTLYKYLTPEDGRTQTEIGSKGRNISKQVKDAIAAENLPGVEFVESISRIYPQNDFASYLVGFAQSDEDGIPVGKMGVEKYMNDELTGTNGYKTYQANKKGYVLPGMKYEEETEVNGNNVYLTIDKYIQEALQDSFKITEETFNTYRAWGVVMEVNSGKILAMGQTPSFNPNDKNITEYSNYISQLPYEAGSTMKVFTYAAAIESGNYQGDQLVDSTTFCYASNGRTPYRVACNTGKAIGTINNASGKNWGMITFDDGLKYSSNVVTSTLITEVTTPSAFKNKLEDFGFFSPVNSFGIEETNGILHFDWPSEKLALSYGQGSTVTTLQMMQAYSSILGDGTMYKPYYIDKVVDPYTGEIISQTEPEVVGNPISESTAKKVQELMYNVSNADDGTARHYRIDEVSIIAKTGTSQVAVNGSYNSGRTISSVAIGLPAEDPKYFVYYAFEADYDYNAHYKTEHVKNLLRRLVQVENRNVELEMNGETVVQIQDDSIMPNVINHSYDYAMQKLESYDVVIVGNGTEIIGQYPSPERYMMPGDMVILLTSGDVILAPDMYGWNRQDIAGFAYLVNRSIKINGYGPAVLQSILPGSEIPEDALLEITAQSAIQKEPEEIEQKENETE